MNDEVKEYQNRWFKKIGPLPGQRKSKMVALQVEVVEYKDFREITEGEARAFLARHGEKNG